MYKPVLLADENEHIFGGNKDTSEQVDNDYVLLAADRCKCCNVLSTEGSCVIESKTVQPFPVVFISPLLGARNNSERKADVTLLIEVS